MTPNLIYKIEKMQKEGTIFYTFNMLDDEVEVINVEYTKIRYGEVYTSNEYRVSPKFDDKTKKIINEFKKENEVLFIRTCNLSKDLNDYLKKNVMTVKQFEVMVRDWDTRRKLKEVVKSGNNKTKRKKRIM